MIKNKMKDIEAILLAIILSLLIFEVDSQIFTKNIQKAKERPSTAGAYCYEGKININIEQGSSSELTYYACFGQTTKECKVQTQRCFNGWIGYYSSVETGKVDGYPNSKENPVFRLNINSPTDYTIKKSDQLGQNFDRIIDIACSQFNPSTAALNTRAKAAFGSYSSSESAGVQIPLFANEFTSRNLQQGSSANRAKYSRKFAYDSANEVLLDRTDNIDVRLSNTVGGGVQSNADNPFNGKVTINLQKRGTQNYNSNKLQADISKISTTFTAADIEKRQQNAKFTDSSVVPKDNLNSGAPATGGNVKKFDLSKQLEVKRPGQKKRLLQQQLVLYSQQQIIYQKNVLGKPLKVSVLITTKLSSNRQTITTKGSLRFSLFGKQKEITIFQKSMRADISFLFTQPFTGTWELGFYVPLPPPVSFMGINFVFSLTYSIGVKLSIDGSNSNGVYTCVFTTEAESSLTTDAQAALQVVLIEGGVFIKGTLVSVKTDPKLTLNYKYSEAIKKIQVLFDWKYHLRAFDFKWGFFWRYKKWVWRGLKSRLEWSDRKPIQQWPVSNPIVRSYPIMNFVKEYIV